MSFYSDIEKTVDKLQLEDARRGEVYPCTIVNDRYSGAYSGALWLAFACDPDAIPKAIGASDPEESNFWETHDQLKEPIGKGATPDEALAHLLEVIIQYYENKK